MGGDRKMISRRIWRQGKLGPDAPVEPSIQGDGGRREGWREGMKI